MECFYRYVVQTYRIEKKRDQLIYTNNFSHCYCTGASVIACKRTNRFLIGLERDEEIFATVLKPLVDQAQSPLNPSSSCDPTEDGEPKRKKPRKYMGALYLHFVFEFLSRFCHRKIPNSTLKSSHAGLTRRLSLHSDLIRSPPSPFALPSYAERLAEQWVAAPSPVPVEGQRPKFPHSVLRFIDFEADQCEEESDAPHDSDNSLDYY